MTAEIDNVKAYTKKSLSRSESCESLELFHKLCREGPTFICVICNRCLYQKSVRKFDRNNYSDLDFEKFSEISNKGIYICLTCHGHFKKRKTPSQAVWNKIEVYDVPNILADLNRLGRVLISRRILFKKVSIMPKGRFPKLKGSICNIPIDLADITNVLPYGADSNGLVVVKLKRKLNYQGHVSFEAVHPEVSCFIVSTAK